MSWRIACTRNNSLKKTSFYANNVASFYVLLDVFLTLYNTRYGCIKHYRYLATNGKELLESRPDTARHRPTSLDHRQLDISDSRD